VANPNLYCDKEKDRIRRGCVGKTEKTKHMTRLVLTIICVVLVIRQGASQGSSPIGNQMKTRWGKEVNAKNVWQEYPRPQLERTEWRNLNGEWQYKIQRKAIPMPRTYQGKILVPFAVESSLSGVQKSFMPEDRLWYRREFEIPKTWSSKKVLLNFDAVDWYANVWINGALIGGHKGAYDRFSFDITPYLKATGKQELVVSVDDPSSSEDQARGKQQMPQEGIWYTPVSGIWQTVWLEAVSGEGFVKEVRMTPNIDQSTISVIPMLNAPKLPEYNVKISVRDGDIEVGSGSTQADKESVIKLDNPKLWSPDSPFLYEVSIQLMNKSGAVIDQVKSYFGMRKISLGIENGTQVLMLNNAPLFHYGTLDQGWWPDGLHTPPSDVAMKYDLEITKQLGFNTIRKHIKVEPDRWYYWCDKIGIMVWQDMPSGMVVINESGKERPTHVQHVGRTANDLNRLSESTAQFEWELKRMVDLHHNSPSIVVWVPFNEGWGQYETCRISDHVKAMDPSRLVNAISGWALRPCGDIYDIHTYQVDVKIPPTSLDRASVIGEYGGIGYPIEGHLWNPKMRNWGYQTYNSADELVKQYKVKFDQILKMKKEMGLSAAIYTQTTDVEGEVNGLITYDREVVKFPPDSLRKMHGQLYKKP
jgi:beta-galactosidase/beta-glucuronidase